MKISKKAIAITVIFAVILAGAAWLYHQFGSRYTPPEIAPSQEETAKTVPDFTVLNEQGNEVVLSDYFGKPIVLNFWATWCGYCKLEMPDFDAAYQEHPEVQFLMVNATDGVRETLGDAKAYIEEKGFSFPVLYDTNGEAVSDYLVRSFPTTYFIDANGHLVSYQSGRMTRDMLEQHIQPLLSEK